MENIGIGLYVFAVGMVVLFLALGALALLIMLLERIFRTRPVAAVPAEPPAVVEDAVSEERLQEMAVALAVGICLLERAEQDDDPNLGELLERPHGRWWSSTLPARPVLDKVKGSG